MLDLDTSRKDPYIPSKAEKDPVIKTLLGAVWEKDPPKITSAKIKGNVVYLDLDLDEENGTIRSNSK